MNEGHGQRANGHRATGPHSECGDWRVEIKVDDRSRVCRGETELVEFLRGLEGELTRAIAARRVEVDARLRFGLALNQAREQVPHGAWMAVYGRLGINERTARSAMVLARTFARPDGSLDVDKVKAARAERGHGEAQAPTVHELRQLATQPNPKSVRRSDLTAAAGSVPVARVPSVPEVDIEGLLGDVGDTGDEDSFEEHLEAFDDAVEGIAPPRRETVFAGGEQLTLDGVYASANAEFLAVCTLARDLGGEAMAEARVLAAEIRERCRVWFERHAAEVPA